MPRHIGFGLLALATARVFVVDLAAMDVAYRAIVLAGLGVLLLVSAWLYTHTHGPEARNARCSGPAHGRLMGCGRLTRRLTRSLAVRLGELQIVRMVEIRRRAGPTPGIIPPRCAVSVPS
jgi:hypothetical protein